MVLHRFSAEEIILRNWIGRLPFGRPPHLSTTKPASTLPLPKVKIELAQPHVNGDLANAPMQELRLAWGSGDWALNAPYWKSHCDRLRWSMMEVCQAGLRLELSFPESPHAFCVKAGGQNETKNENLRLESCEGKCEVMKKPREQFCKQAW